mgnify:CR=1 FL=1
MPLALPLLVSFAEVAGITIGAVATAAGIDLLSEKVESYMEENPEQSQKILAMIMPGQGLAQIFQNKSDKGDEEVSEEIDVEVEEKPKKLSGKEKGQRIKAAIKRARAGRGNYSSPDAEGSAVDIRGSVIREVEDMGIADKDLKDKYDPNKPKFNWRRFTKKNYAYGGGVGHLMEPSQTYHQYHDFTAPMTVGAMVDNMYNRGGRVGMFMGGDPLTGQALAIYNSMNDYGFSDQEIADALQTQGYYTPPGSGTPTPDPDPTPGQGGGQGGGGGGDSFIGGAPSSLVSDFKTQTQNRQNRLTNPNKVQSFVNKFTGGGQADIGEMIRTGQVDTRKTSGLPFGIGAAIGTVLPDKYYDMSLGDQVFTQSQMGYTGPTVFGENTSGLNKDPFGLNTRSAFGNYAEAVGENFNSLRESLTGRLAEKYGVEFDEETGMFVGANADLANKMTNMMRTKFNFRKDQLGAKNRLDSQIKAAQKQRQEAQRIQDELAAAAAAKNKAAALAAIKKQGQADYNPNIHGPNNYGLGSDGKQSYDSRQGFGINSTTGGPVSNKTGRGRTDYSKGGLASMFTRRR